VTCGRPAVVCPSMAATLDAQRKSA